MGWPAHPLQFPGDDADIVNTRRRLYLEPLELPAILLLLTSALTPLTFVTQALLWFEAIQKGDGMLAREFETWSVHWYLWTASILFNSFISVAAIQMFRGRCYWVCVAGSILAILPNSPFFILTIPFGIWSLVQLCRREVRQAFQEFKSIK
jgi:hypothetical protein